MAHFSWGNLATTSPDQTPADQPGLLPVLPTTLTPGPLVLTVGAGEMYATLGAAVAAATSGSTILVNAGTYTNDFANVETKITIEGVGGMANFVATEPPPDEKGIITVDNDVTIKNCSFSGCSISDANGGNGAGIRYEGGQMVLENDAFTDNQNGVMGAPSILGLTNTVTIDHCLFNANGSGSGTTHNVYMGNVASLTFTNNVSEGAIEGHELKSRAYANTITNNVLQDGPTGTASYEIDLPDGGVDVVQNNFIEKGANAPNQAMVHFGGEGIPYAGSSLLITGNQFVNDHGPSTIALLNQTSITATITGNAMGSITPANIAQGPATETGNTDGQGNALPDQTLTGVIPGNTVVYNDSLSHTISLTGTLLAVEGSRGLLSVTAIAGHVVAIGGTGGMNFTEVGTTGGNTIATVAGATDTLNLIGQDLVDSEGHDAITCGSGNVSGQVGGIASISDGTGNDQWSVLGTATITGHGGDPVLTVGSAGSATVTGAVGYLSVTNNGGNFNFNVSQGGSNEALSASGGALDAQVYSGAMSITTAGGPVGSVLRLGAGTANVLSAGADTIYAGSGTETVLLEGAATVYAGTGALAVFGHGDTAGASVYGNGGTTLISGDTGNITYYGGAKASTVQAQLSNIKLVGGAGHLTVTGGSNDVMTGGAGGLTYTATDGGGSNTISTAAAAHDTLTLAGADVVKSYGTDVIYGGNGNQQVAVFGNSTVYGSTANSTLSFAGIDTLNGSASGHDNCTAASGSTLTVNAGAYASVAETAATVKFNIAGFTPAGATLTGGSASVSGGTSTGLAVQTQAGASTNVTIGAGTASVVSFGTDAIHAGTGTNTVTIYGGPSTVWAGTGTLKLFNYDSHPDTQTVYGGRGAAIVTQAGGTMSFIGSTGSATIDGGWGKLSVTGGAGSLTVTGGEGGVQIVAGSGATTIAMPHAGGTVEFGSGTDVVTVANWGAGDLFQFASGHGGGTDTINGFRAGTDQLAFHGVGIVSETLGASSTTLLLNDNTHVVLNGFVDTHHVY